MWGHKVELGISWAIEELVDSTVQYVFTKRKWKYKKCVIIVSIYQYSTTQLSQIWQLLYGC